MRVVTAAGLAALLIASLPAAAQVPAARAPADTTAHPLGTAVVTATPFAIATADAPFAVSARTRSEAEVGRSAPLTLDEITRGIPGLHVADRENPSQGERITMRGVGWRAGFGVRGVQVLLDGIPLTMADGQAVLNVLDPAFVRRVEVIRGPASVFWGNASGGVLALSTLPEGPGPTARVRQTVGSFGLTKTDAQVALTPGVHAVSAYASFVDQGGYRAHSRFRALRAGVSSRLRLGDGRGIEVVGGIAHVPRAEAPGALSRDLLDADPRQADPRSAGTGAGKTVEQGQLGVTYFDRLGGAAVRATAYGVARALGNALPFGYIDLDRRAGGARLTAEGSAGGIAWGVGAEADLQHDDRTEFANVDGGPGPTARVDQRERATDAAAFARATLPVGPLRLSGGLRYDRIRYSVDDRLGAGDGAGDGARTLHALSPSAGVLLPYAGGRAYARVGTALDAPTTQELGNRPDGQGGFNLGLRPEATVGVEAGAAGRLRHLEYDVAVFAARVDDLLAPYQTEAGGPTFYRNEGATRHAGAEVSLAWSHPAGVSLTAAYTVLDAAFTAGASAGRRVPGVPAHRASGALEWQPGPLRLALEAEAASGYYVDSANTAESAGYVVADVRASHAGWPLGRGVTAVPFVAVQNVLDARYSASVVVNAAGGRYFEPAAGRSWRLGVSLDLR